MARETIALLGVQFRNCSCVYAYSDCVSVKSPISLMAEVHFQTSDSLEINRARP